VNAIIHVILVQNWWNQIWVFKWSHHAMVHPCAKFEFKMESSCHDPSHLPRFHIFLIFFYFLLLRSNFGQRRLTHISRARYWAFTLNQQLIWCDNVVYFVGINGFQSFAMYFWYLLCKKKPYSLQIAKSTFFPQQLLEQYTLHKGFLQSFQNTVT